jgi:penicillin-binding protein 1A
MNVINTGHNCYGVQSAAKTYFNKDVKDLDLAECASIAGITNLPCYYDPLGKYGKEPNKKRQELVLKKMFEQKKISQAEYEQAVNEKLKFVQGDTKELTNSSTQSYFVDQVVLDVKRDLMAKGLSEQIALKTIYNNGLKIYTTMDSTTQKAMDEVYNDPKFFPSLPGKADLPQSGMVLIDPKTGQIRALYGGNGKKTGNTQNMATQIQRAVGSSFKPIAVYGPAKDQKIITAGTVVDDVPLHLDSTNRAKLYPKNQVAGDYRGLTTIRDAIANSVNTVAAQVYMMNPDVSYPYLRKVGINRDGEKGVSFSLGGLTTGLSPLQMAGAYIPFDNKGVYVEPTTYTKVVDSKGNTILEKKPKNTIVYSQATSYIMTSMMQSVVQYGTAYPNGIITNGKGQVIPTAGKTGTTSDDWDRWFIGYSPYYVGAVWYGYKTPTDLSGINNLPGWNGVNPSLKIWREVMTRVHKNLDPVAFPDSPNIVRKSICVYSGKLPGALCEKDPRNISGVKGSLKYNEVFISGTEPTEFCDVHIS